MAVCSPGVTTFNTLLGAISKRGHFQKAEHLMSMMRKRDCPPNTITFTLVINTYAKVSISTNKF